MLGWLGVLLVIIALWYNYCLVDLEHCIQYPIDGRLRNMDEMQKLTNKDLDHFYENTKAHLYLDRCYPIVSDQFASMFAEQSGSANLGLRIGDVPPEIFYS